MQSAVLEKTQVDMEDFMDIFEAEALMGDQDATADASDTDLMQELDDLVHTEEIQKMQPGSANMADSDVLHAAQVAQMQPGSQAIMMSPKMTQSVASTQFRRENSNSE